MTFLVLCEPDDAAALWAADRLAEPGSRQVRVLTSRELSTAHDWAHRIGVDGVEVSFTVGSGDRFRSGGIRGTLNRLRGVPDLPALARSAPGDRRYVHAEWTAFCLGWLRGLPGPVLNPPDPRGLGGSGRDPREWRALATAAGLGRPSAAREAGDTFEVLVIGDRVVGCSPDRATTPAGAEACLRLAASAGTPVLGVTLSHPGPAFVAATECPDLRHGGLRAVAALDRALGRHA